MSLHPEHVAWMGGSSPRPGLEVIGTPEGDYVVKLYWDQIDIWVAFWEERCPAEQREIFFGRARYDAHATYRDAA